MPPPYSLIGTIGAYLGGLVIMPLITICFIGADFLNPFKVILVLAEAYYRTAYCFRILTMWARLDRRLEPVRGNIINWTFFVFNYTVVGLNRDVFLHRPLSLLPLVFIAFVGMFLLGWAIQKVSDLMRIDPEIRTSLILLGTLKNYGIAGGVALALFNRGGDHAIDSFGDRYDRLYRLAAIQAAANAGACRLTFPRFPRPRT